MRAILLAIARRLPPGLLRRVGTWQWTGPLARKLVAASSGWLRHQDVVMGHGIGAGLRFNAAGANPGYALGTSEPLVQEELARMVRPGDVVYDIGSNVGFFTVLCAKLAGPAGRVIAFEPLEATAQAARRNAELNQFGHVTVLTRAVGKSSGTARLTLQQESTWTRMAGEGDAGPTFEVALVAIDDLVASGDVPPPNVVKIDVEGAELDVIEGMKDTLAAHRPRILCEMHGKNAAFAALMTSLHYDVRTLQEPVPLADARWDVHAIATPRA